MKKYLVLFTLPLLLLCIAKRPALAAPTDIVPRGSALLDAFAALSQADGFGASDTPEDFLGEPLYTRAQLAHLLEHLVQDDPKKLACVQKDESANAALQSALSALQPELSADGTDLSDMDDAPAHGTSVSGFVQPELRLRTGGDAQPSNDALSIYRVTALGNLRSNLRYVFSASNWPQDHRRVFDNDIGTHDFSSPLNEAYLELDGGRGLKVDLGQMYDRWGPGMRGATMLGDNAPPLTQLQVSFPFSLGARAGRNFSYTQMVSSFTSNDATDYFAAHRIAYTFSNQWYADFQESFLSDRAWSLQFAPFVDYYNIKNANIPILKIREKGLDPHYKVAFNFTGSYTTPDDGLRLYGQFMIHDLRSPGPKSGVTPRKISYLIGGSVRPVNGTRLTLEYIFDDPTTYSSRTIGTQWEEGRYDELALPGGPNATEYYGRLEQKIGSKLTVTLEGRDRERHDLSFPAPTARSLAATASYATTKKSDIQVIFHDYRQDPFPLAPSVPVGNGLQPSNAEGNYGQRLRIQQLDLAYQFFF